MKKTKLLMPIIGISAIVASLAPLSTLTSCNKQELKVELTNNTALETKLYANTKTLNLFFKQNNTNNVTKTRVKIVNLKINGAEAASVAGLTKISVDSAGGIRVTFNIATMYKHYSNPNSIEFDLLFYNNTNKQSCTVEGFKFNIDQEVEIPHPFEVEDSTVITGFIEDVADYTAADFARAYPEIFVQFTVPALAANQKQKLATNNVLSSSQKEIVDYTKLSEDKDTTAIYYSMVIPAKYTEIADEAFMLKNSNAPQTSIPSSIVSLDFAYGSKMERIGRGAFITSPFIFVTLPSSIKTLGASCFEMNRFLTSFKFPAKLDHNQGLILPDGMLAGSLLPYVKLPTYIKQFGNTNIPVFTETEYFDFSEWSADLIANLTFATNSLVRPISAVFTNGKNVLEALNKHIVNLGLQSITLEISYIFKASGEDVALVPPKYAEAITNIFQTIHTIALKSNKYGLYRYELPNYYTADKTTTPVKVNKIQGPIFHKYLAQIESKVGSPLSSLVLPSYLDEIPAESTPLLNGLGLWQVNIPATITSLKKATIVSNKSLCSLVYEGTKEQWATLLKNSEDGWIDDCPQVDVWCSDGKANPIESTENGLARE